MRARASHARQKPCWSGRGVREDSGGKNAQSPRTVGEASKETHPRFSVREIRPTKALPWLALVVFFLTPPPLPPSPCLCSLPSLLPLTQSVRPLAQGRSKVTLRLESRSSGAGEPRCGSSVRRRCFCFLSPPPQRRLVSCCCFIFLFVALWP